MRAGCEGGTLSLIIFGWYIARLEQSQDADVPRFIGDVASDACWVQNLAAGQPTQLYNRSSRQKGSGRKHCRTWMGSLLGFESCCLKRLVLDGSEAKLVEEICNGTSQPTSTVHTFQPS